MQVFHCKYINFFIGDLPAALQYQAKRRNIPPALYNESKLREEKEKSRRSRNSIQDHQRLDQRIAMADSQTQASVPQLQSSERTGDLTLTAGSQSLDSAVDSVPVETRVPERRNSSYHREAVVLTAVPKPIRRFSSCSGKIWGKIPGLSRF